MANERVDPWKALEEYIKAFPHIPDKEQAWNDLHRSSMEWNANIRWSSAYVIGSVFYNLPKKQQAWEDLIRLVKDSDIGVQYSAAEALINAFPYVPDKQKAWNDLNPLVKDRFILVTLQIFIKIFFYIPDQQHVWEDLYRLAKDKTFMERWNVAYALGEVLNYIPDKQQEWQDLIRGIQDEVVDPHLKRSMIDQMLKKKIREIKEIARKVSIESKGTPNEEIIDTFNKTARKWKISETELDQALMTHYVDDLIFNLKRKISSEDKNLYDQIEDIRKENNVVKQYELISRFIGSIQTSLTIVKEVKMGDNYNIKGQIGAAGAGAHAENMTFNQIWNESKSDIDLPTLALELSKLRSKMKEEATEPEHDSSMGAIASAEISAKKGDGPKAIEYLKHAGNWALDVAKTIGVPVATTALTKALGL